MRIDTQKGDSEQPEVRCSFNTSWVKNDWNVSLTINYIGLENTTLSLGATNLFNEEPPFTYHDLWGL